MATNPLTSVARPKIVDKSPFERPTDEAEDINHDSNAEYSIDPEMPPQRRPTSRTGRIGKSDRTHVEM